MATYRIKQATIQAMVFTDDPAKLLELGEFVDNGDDGWVAISYADREHPKLSINTPDGELVANVGDYLVKSEDDGAICLYAPDKFAKIFEAVE